MQIIPAILSGGVGSRLWPLSCEYFPKQSLPHYGDLTGLSNLTRILQEVKPNEVYNLGAQSHVAVFESPEYTADVDAMGALRLFCSYSFAGIGKKHQILSCFYLRFIRFSLVREILQKETTPFPPSSPYAVAKMHAYWIVLNYRESYGMYAFNGVLF